MKTPPRTVVHIVWDAERKLWLAKVSGQVVDYGDGTKAWFVKYHAARLHNTHQAHGIRGQIVVHAKNGRIQFERTYPDVTPRRRG